MIPLSTANLVTARVCVIPNSQPKGAGAAGAVPRIKFITLESDTLHLKPHTLHTKPLVGAAGTVTKIQFLKPYTLHPKL